MPPRPIAVKVKGRAHADVERWMCFVEKDLDGEKSVNTPTSFLCLPLRHEMGESGREVGECSREFKGDKVSTGQVGCWMFPNHLFEFAPLPLPRNHSIIDAVYL